MTAHLTRPPNSMAADAPNSVLDVAAALRRFCGEREDLREVAMMFLDYAPEHLRSLDDSWTRQDFDAVRHTAHRLCGAAANLSAVAFEQTARQLETAVAADRGSLPDLIQRLHQEFDSLQVSIRAL